MTLGNIISIFMAMLMTHSYNAIKILCNHTMFHHVIEHSNTKYPLLNEICKLENKALPSGVCLSVYLARGIVFLKTTYKHMFSSMHRL